MKSANLIEFDVMEGDYFRGTFQMEYRPRISVKIEEMMKVVEKRLPTLRGKDYRIIINKINGRKKER